jgi:hypothetical protein
MGVKDYNRSRDTGIISVRFRAKSVWRYTPIEIVRRQKCRHAVLESVTAYVAVTRAADASQAAITLMIVPVGALETHPLEV